MSNDVQKPRILLILEPAITETDYESKYAPLLLKHLDVSRYELRIISSSCGKKAFESLSVPVDSISIGPSSYRGMKLLFGYLLYLFVAFIRGISIAKKMRPHIVMSLGGHTYSGLLATLIAKLANSQSAIRIAGPTRLTLRARHTLGSLYSSIAKFLENFVIEKADLVLANSQLDRYLDPTRLSKVHVVSQGVDLNKFHLETEPSRTNGPTIVIIARLSPEKRIANVIRSISHLIDHFPKIKLRVIGDGPQREFLENLARDMNLDEMVAFEGYIHPDSIPHHFHSADAFVLVSLRESLPSALLEAMACGVPTVVSESWAARIGLADGANTVMSSGMPMQIAASIKKIIEDADFRESLIQTAYDYVRENHSSSEARAKVFKLIHEIAAK